MTGGPGQKRQNYKEIIRKSSKSTRNQPTENPGVREKSEKNHQKPSQGKTARKNENFAQTARRKHVGVNTGSTGGIRSIDCDEVRARIDQGQDRKQRGQRFAHRHAEGGVCIERQKSHRHTTSAIKGITRYNNINRKDDSGDHVAKCQSFWGPRPAVSYDWRTPFGPSPVDVAEERPTRSESDIQVYHIFQSPDQSMCLPNSAAEDEKGVSQFIGAFNQTRSHYISGGSRIFLSGDSAAQWTHSGTGHRKGGAKVCESQCSTTRGQNAVTNVGMLGQSDQLREEKGNAVSEQFVYKIIGQVGNKNWKQLGFTAEEIELIIINPIRDTLIDIPKYYGRDAIIRLQSKTVKARREISRDPLGEITRNRLDYIKVINLAFSIGQDIGEILDWVRTDKLMKLLLLNQTDIVDRDRKVRISRHLLDEWNMLEEAGVIVKSAHQCKSTISLFKVPKKGGTSRLIADCRPINRRAEGRLKMCLPDIRDVLDEVARRKYKVQFDGKSYFYQFGLEGGAHLAFPISIGGKRGDFEKGFLKVLPMGFTLAPAIAQAVSEVVCEKIRKDVPEVYVEAWIDNFVLASDDRKLLEKAVQLFLVTCKEISLELKSEKEEISMTIDLLGVSIGDGVIHITREDDQKLEKLKEKALTQKTNRDYYEIVGMLMWLNHVIIRKPLACWEDILVEMGKVGRAIANGSQWDAERVSGGENEEKRLLNIIAEARGFIRVIHRKCKSMAPKKVFTDATPTAAGWQGPDWGIAANHINDRSIQIYLSEFLALATALFNDEGEFLFCDNKAVVAAMKKGVSRSLSANMVIRKLCEKQKGEKCLQWIPSKMNRADGLSRGHIEMGTQAEVENAPEKMRW